MPTFPPRITKIIITCYCFATYKQRFLPKKFRFVTRYLFIKPRERRLGDWNRLSSQHGLVHNSRSGQQDSVASHDAAA